MHPGDLEALEALLGDTRSDTTQVYLRKLNRTKAMERVRDLDRETPFSGFSPNQEGAYGIRTRVMTEARIRPGTDAIRSERPSITHSEASSVAF